ncbi:MAG TPA: YceI family protein [Gemmatimonadaceae bacterium]|nr:YceI family protein [Gemmatimonadaceae bacterium]
MMPRQAAPVVCSLLGAAALLAARPAPRDAAVVPPARGRPAAAGRAAVPADTLRFVVAPTGNEARYRVREQLVRRDLPNDAIGRTTTISGGIAVDGAGKVIPGASRFVVDVTELKSDSDRRDGYVRRRLLETERYPTVELVPTAVQGLPSPLPAAGPVSFQLVGDLTVHGTTRPTTWQVTGQYQGGRITGTARTGFTFADFGLTQPRVPILLSVADTITLEYDFTLTPQR